MYNELICVISVQHCVGLDNSSRLHTKLVSLCPDFTKDSESCWKKWSVIYNDYKEEKIMNMRSDSQRSKKCRWYTLLDEFMSDKAHVVTHVHASATNSDGPKLTIFSDTNTAVHKSWERKSKSPRPKRNEDVFRTRCPGEIRETSKQWVDSMKASEDMKLVLLMSMQKTMEKLVEKLWVQFVPNLTH